MDIPESASPLDQALLAAPHDQANRRFIAAWLHWRAPGRLLPKRSAVELEDVKGLLGRVILFELISGDEILVKVAGSQIREHSNFEATGRNLRDVTPREQWPVRRWRMNAAATLPCGAWMVSIDTRTNSGEAVTFETVTLPIEADGPEKPRLLMSNVAVLGGIYEPPAKDRPQLAWLPDEFRFLDLGAGVPNRIEP
ncbi:MAG TPA: PAS domain-containing protein [Stellaceae bacterium]|nr:PAS domain-containing protein [Stellaceae bacterium]